MRHFGWTWREVDETPQELRRLLSVLEVQKGASVATKLKGPWACCVCLFRKGKLMDAVTTVKGYRVCQKHLSFKTDFFRDWEAAQDPHSQPKLPKKDK